MTVKYFFPLTAIIALAACSGTYTGSLPENVAAIAAPNQDVSTAFLKEADGCYWYLYSGPVETTELPLRNVDGRPICTRAPTS